MAEFENTHDADAEGWGIFECNGSENGLHQICGVDDAGGTGDDDAAWRYVVARAKEGSDYHRGALDFIRINAPAEWCSFGEVHGEPLLYLGGEPMLDAEGYLIDTAGGQVDGYGDLISESDEPDAKPLRFRQGGGRWRDFEVARTGEFVTFRPISSAARQWCIDAMPDGIHSAGGVYSAGGRVAATIRAEISAEGFAVKEEA